MNTHLPAALRRRVIEKASRREPFECPFCHFVFIFGIQDPNINVDHIVPRSRGGLTVEENLQVICRSCNKSKWYHRDIPKADRKMVSRLVLCSCGIRFSMSDFDYHVNIDDVRVNGVLCETCSSYDEVGTS